MLKSGAREVNGISAWLEENENNVLSAIMIFYAIMMIIGLSGLSLYANAAATTNDDLPALGVVTD